jgi:methyl-accepting chemotaxis protein
MRPNSENYENGITQTLLVSNSILSSDSYSSFDAENELQIYREFIKTLVGVCNRIGEGDLEARLVLCDKHPVVQECVKSVNNVLDLTDAFVRESSACLNYAAQGKFWRRFLSTGMSGGFVRALDMINVACNSMSNQSEILKEKEQESIRKNQELARNFEQVIGEVVSSIAASSTELRATSESLSKLAIDSADQATAVAAASEESSVMTKELGNSARRLEDAVQSISKEVEESGNITRIAVKEASRTHEIVMQLSQASERIGGITGLINRIAAQTNLLALNATIEAARAGAAGKGFAVVASEVKALANQTSEATRSISEEVDSIRSATNTVVKAISDISKTISSVEKISDKITESVEEQRQTFSDMSKAVEQTKFSSDDISQNIAGVRQSVDETSNAASEVLNATKELSLQTETLNTTARKFVEEILNR